MTCACFWIIFTKKASEHNACYDKRKAIDFKAIMMMGNERITGTFQKLKSKYLFVK